MASKATGARPRHLLITTAAVLLLAAAGAWPLLHRDGAAAAEPGQPNAPAKAAPPVQVSTVRVAARDVPIYEAGIGTVAATQSVTVRARIDGQLDQVAFAEGQDVKAGQLLARIDPRALAAQLAQAKAQRAKDVAQLASARADLQRITTLVAQDAATRQQLDTQQSLVAQLDAALQTDDAQIRYAQVQLDYTRIEAPIAGRLGARLVDAGNIVHAADANGLVVINQVDPIAVVFTLPEADFQAVNAALAAGRPLPALAFARDGGAPLGSGSLTLVNNQIDTATGTIQLKASFANPRHMLWPGQYVNVRLMLGDRPQALTVPAAVVQRGQQGTYAYTVAADGSAQAQPIEVAQIQDGLAVIQAGLHAGDRVVLDGQYKLKPGAQVVEAAAAPAGGASAATGGAK